MRFGSLFAGIGGFDLGLERAGMTCAWQVENDPYCNRVLAKHWPDVPRYGDIRTIRWESVEPVDVLCGGFPCQPVSLAGKRLGERDERWLWPEFARAIRDLRTRIVLMENVPGLLRNEWFGAVLRDLALLGYDAEWTVLSAGRLGAHFPGQRLFILATDSPTCSTGLLRGWTLERASYPWGRDEFEGLVRQEIQSGVPAGSLGRISDGVPSRVDRLRGLGNAIVPQCAEVIGRYVMAIECG